MICMTAKRVIGMRLFCSLGFSSVFSIFASSGWQAWRWGLPRLGQSVNGFGLLLCDIRERRDMACTDEKGGSLTGDGDGLQKEPGSLSSSYFPFIDNYPTSSVSRPKQRDFL